MNKGKLDLTGIKRPMSEEEIGKAYVESMIMLPPLLQAVMQQLVDMADSMSLLALYIEKKGLKEELFTEEELSEGSEDE